MSKACCARRCELTPAIPACTCPSSVAARCPDGRATAQRRDVVSRRTGSMKGIFHNWTIGKRLTGAFALMSMLVATVGMIGSANLTTMRRDAGVITTSAREAGRYALIQVDMLKQVEAEKDYLLSGDPKHREAHRTLGRQIEAALNDEIKRSRDVGDAKRAEALEQVKSKSSGYEATFAEVTALYEQRHVNEAV